MQVPPPIWLRDVGPDSDVVVSTRCRIARNLTGFPFPWRAGELESKQSAELILTAAERSGCFRDARPIAGSHVDSDESVQLVRWRYASRDWAAGGRNRWLVVAGDTTLSLLVNEEDHIRLQSITPGLQVESVLLRAEEADTAMGAALEFATLPEVGFLTTSLTNAGTGMRISVLMHLAGLASSMAGRLEAVLDAARSLGCAVRGLYGEGSSGTGELFQVSNRYTFGLAPEQIADHVASASKYLIQEERSARQEQFGTAAGRERLAGDARRTVRDLYEQEAPPARLLRWVSTLRLAVSEGILPGRLSDTAEWVSIAGTEAALPSTESPSDSARDRFLAISRTSALRQRLRPLLEA
jgi:protein arginine kinase